MYEEDIIVPMNYSVVVFTLYPLPQSEVVAHKRRGVVLFSYLKKLNRLSHLYCKDSREQTHEVSR